MSENVPPPPLFNSSPVPRKRPPQPSPVEEPDNTVLPTQPEQQAPLPINTPVSYEVQQPQQQGMHFSEAYNNFLPLIEKLRWPTKKQNYFHALDALRYAHESTIQRTVAAFQADQEAWNKATELYNLRSLTPLIEEKNREIQEKKDYIVSLEEYHQQEIQRRNAELVAIQNEIVRSTQVLGLQEVSLYEYYNPAQDSPALKRSLDYIQQEIKKMITAKAAIESTSGFIFNNSAKEGAKFVKDFTTLMLTAYNSEAENAIVKAERGKDIDAALTRIDKAAAKIEKMGTMLSCKISPTYHQLRRQEIELAFQYKEKLYQEREEEKARRAELREAEKAEREAKKQLEELRRKEKEVLLEIQRQEEQKRLEQQRVEAELEQARLSGLIKEQERLQHILARISQDDPTLTKLKLKLNEVESAKSQNSTLLANSKAGYVYVISNKGSFGEEMVKIGLTRRVNPQDRVDELGDASVPFRFDVHVIHYSDNAVALEDQLHKHFADRAVNKVNRRKEFFRVPSAEVLEAMQNYSNGTILTFDTSPVSPEYEETLRIETTV